MAGKEIEALSYIKKPTRRPGRLKGKIKIAKDFDDPISEKNLLLVVAGHLFVDRTIDETSSPLTRKV